MDALYLGLSDNGSGHDMFKLSNKQKISARKVTLIPLTEDIIKRINIMGKEEGEPDGLELTDLFGNIGIHDIKLGPNPHGMFDDDDSNISDADFAIDEAGINKEIFAEEALDAGDTFYNAREELDSNTEVSEVDPDLDAEDSEVGDPEPVIENPEVREANHQTTEEVGEDLEEEIEQVLLDKEEIEEVLEEKVYENMEEPIDDPKGRQLRYQIQNHYTPDTYWIDVSGVGTDGSDMILIMIKNYSYIEPIKNYPDPRSKASPKSILSASKFTPQYYYTKGIKIFEHAGYKTTKQELDENLIGRNCVEVLPITKLDDDIKKKALNYLMFLKQKRCRKTKAGKLRQRETTV